MVIEPTMKIRKHSLGRAFFGVSLSFLTAPNLIFGPCKASNSKLTRRHGERKTGQMKRLRLNLVDRMTGTDRVTVAHARTPLPEGKMGF